MYPRSLADFSGEYRESGSQLVYQHCPVCNSAGWHVYVNPDTGEWYCFARGHGGGGRVTPGIFTDETRRAMIAQLRYEATSPAAWPEVELPDWRKLGVGARMFIDMRRTVLQPEYHVVEATAEPRIIVPFFGPDRKIISWIARDYTGTLIPKYTQAPGAKPMFMLPRWEPVDTLVLVEGVFDAFAVASCGHAVAAIGGTHLSSRSEQDLRQLVRRRITILLDNDEAGQRAMPKLRDRLRDRYDVVSNSHLLPPDCDPAQVHPKDLITALRR